MSSLLMFSQPTEAGVAQCVLDWSAGLRARGWDVTVACPPTGPLTGWCEDAGVPVTAWPSVRSPYSGVRSELRRLRAIVAAEQPDAVMLHSSKAGLIGRLAIRGRTPTVFVPHAWSFDAAAGFAGWASLRWEIAAARWADVLLCVSEAERTRGLAAGVKGRYVVARNGVDVAGLRTQVGPDRNATRTELGIAAERNLVVCVGRLTEQKGQDVLLRAWPDVTVDATLVLVGSGPDLPRLEELARTAELDRKGTDIRFVGALDRSTALQWLAAADLAVTPSRWEGMALVPLEAMALGTPVVASDITGIREAVVDGTGLLVSPDDPGALARAISNMLEAPDREATRLRCAARIEAEFALAATVDSVAAATDSVMTR